MHVSLLVFLSYVTIFRNTLSQERSIWTWNCKNNHCEKQELKDGERPHNLEVCTFLCDPNGNLWPKPLRIIHLEKDLINVNPYSVTVLPGQSKGLSDQMREMIREAGIIFQKNSFSYVSSEERVEDDDRGKSLQVELHIQNLNEFAFKSNTDEGYEIRINTTSDGRINAAILAKTYFGARHGLQTLSQLIVRDWDRKFYLSRSALIADRPAYIHRGITLDTSRSFISIAHLMKTVDAMSQNKMNTLHLHLTDTHSFPFQSEKYPDFSRYGAYSPEKVYTIKDLRKLVMYARYRGVRIVPEFDEPAHVGEGWQWVGDNATVCFKAEPWRQYCVEPPCGQLNPTSDKVYSILAGLFEEMLEVFDSDIFHMGGDEVSISCWNSSSVITDWMAQNGFPPTKNGFLDLWKMFQTKAYEKLTAANKGVPLPVILWTSGLTESGTVEQYLDKDKYIIQIWTTGQDTVVSELVNKGYRVIFSNYDALYFDCGFGAWVGEGNNWCSPYIGWQKVYENSPVKLLEKQGVKGPEARLLALGAEATLFTEQADGIVVDSRLWPRAAALAERLWSEPTEGWKEAEHRMLHQRERLVRSGIFADTLQPEWCYQNQGLC